MFCECKLLYYVHVSSFCCTAKGRIYKVTKFDWQPIVSDIIQVGYQLFVHIRTYVILKSTTHLNTYGLLAMVFLKVHCTKYIYICTSFDAQKVEG